MKKTYILTGMVYGNFWGGGKGAYTATTLSDTDKDNLLNEAKYLLSTGGLDGGMGYESLIGALITIETITTTEIDGKTFTNREYESEFIGELTEEEEEFLQECELNI